MTFRKFFSAKTKAFSLVELAIALVIIGLLIGAVLKGQDLLENARLKTIISQLNQYRLAVNTFTDRYGALPGDYDKATDYIKSSLKNGDNDGIIQTADETLSFWAHLEAAELIPDATPPATKIGGVITIAHDPIDGLQGHWFIISQKNKGGILTPLQALILAKKLDNENPFSGTVQIRNGAGATNCLKGKILNTTNKSKACVLYVKL